MLHDPWFWAFVATFVAGYISTAVIVDDGGPKLTAHQFIALMLWVPIVLCCFAVAIIPVKAADE